ncbi:hypothetical protein QYM36_004108 [Artemia franciscana]|uniref:Uncharacterized protein n=1 Tax=Artemia franciscana TaxID=6661 RepID=A0AA88LC70_ARTSF|nr:hypothetical protein QYM36_004108 [Artemia franciscana]
METDDPVGGFGGLGEFSRIIAIGLVTFSSGSSVDGSLSDGTLDTQDKMCITVKYRHTSRDKLCIGNLKGLLTNIESSE